MKFGRFNLVAKNMVNELFRIEAEANYKAAQVTTLSVKVEIPTAAMLSVLSELFGQSRFTFTGEILGDFTADLFFNLPDDVRADLAEKADKITTELLSKQGISVQSAGAAGLISEDQTWRSLNISAISDCYKNDFSDSTKKV